MRSVLDGSVADDAPRADPPRGMRPWQARADEFDRAHRRGRRRLWGACVACVAALTLAVPLLIAPMFADEQYPEVCDALFVPVQGLDIELRHANGFSSGFSTDWAGVLTEVLWVANDQRPAIAAAVTADEAGYQRILAGVSNDLRPAIEHLHATVSNPEVAAATTSWVEGRQVIESPATLAALQAVKKQFGFEGCGRKWI